ncbi:TPA: hypothetical protein ACNKK1_000313 [Enterococcus faecalis]
MKSIIKHFVPNKFKKQKELLFSNASFIKVMIGYGILLTFLLIIYGTIGNENGFTENKGFLYFQIIYSVIVILINGISYIQFKKIKLQKYLVLVVYFSGVLGIFSGIALLSLITDRPLHNFVVGMIAIFIGWILELLVHALLVWWSLKRNNLKLIDTATNYFSNVIGILGISLAIISYVTEKEDLFFLAACLIVMVVLFFVTFDFQRVYEYWKTKKNEDVSAYGNSIEMMKSKKTKK